jgi:hypothetical protein
MGGPMLSPPIRSAFKNRDGSTEPNAPLANVPMKARRSGEASRQVVLVHRGDPLRDRTEACIREVYRNAFGAEITAFPELLVAALDGTGQPICAAGLRTEADGFFSENYLDHPVEQVLGTVAERDVARGRIFEVTTLASCRAKGSSDFVRRIADLGKSAGFEWCVFTATSRLRILLHRLGFPLVVLGPADPARIENAENWGSYYAHSPLVCAVHDRRPSPNSSDFLERLLHA